MEFDITARKRFPLPPLAIACCVFLLSSCASVFQEESKEITLPDSFVSMVTPTDTESEPPDVDEAPAVGRTLLEQKGVAGFSEAAPVLAQSVQSPVLS